MKMITPLVDLEVFQVRLQSRFTKLNLDRFTKLNLDRFTKLNLDRFTKLNLNSCLNA